jgi:hypothetical protein
MIRPALCVMASVLAVPAHAAAPQEASDEELSEVLVLGQRALKDRGLLDAWLRRLIGKFGNTGEVLGPSGRQQARGTTACESVGNSAGVHCVMKLKAPNYQTSFDPGELLLGMDIVEPKIRFMTVDDLGYAAGDSSDVVGDTVRFRTSCQASGGRTCFAYTSIMVRSRSDDIRFRVRIEVEGKEWSRFELILIRQ